MNSLNADEHLTATQQRCADTRCGYPSKRCENSRSVKRTGELHRLCNHHRVIANRNQQRLQQRRRMLRQPLRNAQEDTTMATDVCLQQQQQQCPDLLPRHRGYASDAEAPLHLDEEDLRVLEALLFDESLEEDTVFDGFFNAMVV